MDREARRYVRKLEAALAARADGPRVFSRKDYDLAMRWQRDGIPAGLVLETIARRRIMPRSLAQVAAAVEESWAAVRSGARRSPSGGHSGPEDPPASPEHQLQAAVEAAGQGTGLRRFLEGLLQSCRGGADPADLEQALEQGLVAAVDEELRADAEERARAALHGFEARMSPEALEQTVRKGTLARLRRELGIPRFH